MLSTDTAMWLMDWGFPVSLGLMAAAGYIMGSLSRWSRGATPPKPTKPGAINQMEAVTQLASIPPQRVYPLSPRNGAPRLAWCRLPGDVLELEGGSGHYIQMELGNVQPFVLRDGTHRLIRRGSELDMLMREGEHLATIDATAAALCRPRMPRLRDR